MPHSPDTQLMQDLRDTSGHRFSVQIKLMLAAVTLVPVIMVQFMVPLLFRIATILLFIIPGHLFVAAMQEVVARCRATAHASKHDGPLPVRRRTTMMTVVIFESALLLTHWLMYGGVLGPIAGMLAIAVPVVIFGYHFYLAFFRPRYEPNINPSRDDAVGDTRAIIGSTVKRVIINVAVLFVILMGLVYFVAFMAASPQQLPSLFL